MSNLKDLLNKKKPVVTVLDLSKNVIQAKDDFKRLMEKVPDYKIRPIKVRAEDIIIKDKDFSFKMLKKEARKLLKSSGVRDPLFYYLDPIPNEMKEIILMELCCVPIDWKMLTISRPKIKLEEKYFSRMVEMGKLQLRTEERDRREGLLSFIKKIKNKSGILETRLMTCSFCGEEMCNGRSCSEFNYDLFIRTEVKLPKAKPVPSNTNSNFNTRKKFKSKNHKPNNTNKEGKHK